MIGQAIGGWRARLGGWGHALLARTTPWRLALRLIVAGLVALAVADSLALPQGYWSVITALIVIQGNVGGSLKAARDRLVATLLGALCGLFAVTVLPPPEWGRTAAFLLALLPTAWAAATSPSFRIAPVTAVMLLLSISPSLTPFEVGVDRVVEIALGGFIGLAVSLVVLPARAHRDLRLTLQQALLLSADGLAPITAGLSSRRDDAAVRARHRQIRAALVKADALAQEARQETAARLTEERDPDALLATARRIHTNLILLGRATVRPLPPVVAARFMPSVLQATAELSRDLLAVGTALTAGTQPPDLQPVGTALQGVNEGLAQLRGLGLTRTLTLEEMQDLFAIAFALGQFRRDLVELHRHVSDLAR